MTVKELIIMLLDQPMDKHVLFWADYEDFSSFDIKKIGNKPGGYYTKKYPDFIHIELE